MEVRAVGSDAGVVDPESRGEHGLFLVDFYKPFIIRRNELCLAMSEVHPIEDSDAHGGRQRHGGQQNLVLLDSCLTMNDRSGRIHLTKR